MGPDGLKVARQMRTLLVLLILGLVMAGTFSANWKVGCLATAFTLWKILRLTMENTK